MAAHDDDAGRVAAREPREHVDDVRLDLGRSPDQLELRVVLDAEAAAARLRVALKLRVDPPSRGADAPCLGDVVSENVLRVPKDTSVESIRRMFVGLISGQRAVTRGCWSVRCGRRPWRSGRTTG